MTESPSRSTLDRIRIKLGLPVPVMLRFCGLRTGRRNFLRAPDERVEDVFLERAHDLEQRYDAWKAEILRAVRRNEPLTIPAFAQLFGVSESTMWRDARSGLLPTSTVAGYLGRPEYRVSAADAEQFFAAAEQVLAHIDKKGRPQRGPLSLSFQRVIEPNGDNRSMVGRKTQKQRVAVA